MDSWMARARARSAVLALDRRHARDLRATAADQRARMDEQRRMIAQVRRDLHRLRQEKGLSKR